MGIVDPVTKDLSDEELVRRSAGGDEKAISELYDRYSRPVYATGLRLLGDTSLAEELVQDAFTRVWTSVQTFDSSRARFATWLYRITRNRAVDLDRRRRARPSLAGADLLHDVSGDPDPEANVDDWDVAQRSPASRTVTGRS
jgi:RNA polymerase sigma-70 factor, ECF subfamily